MYAVVEGLSFGGLWLLRATRGIDYFPGASRLGPQGLATLDSFLVRGTGTKVGLDPDLGWNREPSGALNAAGMRDDREYPLEPDSGILRISAFGESFTYGSDVPLERAWAKRMSAINPSIEVLNYGVGAFGLDQAYLRYLRDGTQYHPHIVIIGYMSENLARNVNVFRGFYTNGYRDFILSKPRFRLVGDSLELIPNPLRSLTDYRRLRDSQEIVLGELGKNDYHFTGHYRAGPFDFSPTVRLGKLVAAQLRKHTQVSILDAKGVYHPPSEAFTLTVRIFDEFYRKVQANGALPLIVVFPDITDHQRSRAGLPRRYEPLLAYFRGKNYRFIDILDAIKPVEERYSIEDLTVNWGHFSELGNEIIARHILAVLAEWKLEEVSRVERAAARERAVAQIATASERD